MSPLSSKLSELADSVRSGFLRVLSPREAPVDAVKIVAPAGGEEEDALYEETDTDRCGLLVDEADASEEDRQAQLAEDEGRWWYFPGNELDEIPPLPQIDEKTVCADLAGRIERNEFPLIEIPDNVMRAMRVLNDPEFQFTEVANTISRSPAMAGEFIRVANSSLFNRGIEIHDLRAALPRIGRDNIRSMLYLYSTRSGLSSHPLVGQMAAVIIDHSYATGLIASYLSQRFFPDPDLAFLAGLLHDIGKLGVLKAIGDDYELPVGIDVEMAMAAMENRVFPGVHERAGALLGENWKLDPPVLAAIAHHHDFRDITFFEDEEINLHLSCLINVSDAMARMLGRGRRIGKTHVFGLDACTDLNMDKTPENIRFLEDIPRIINLKTTDSEPLAPESKQQ